MKLSIFLGGIRPQNWLKLYNSIPNTTTLSKEKHELVIVSPYDLPPELQNVSNVKLVKDWGNPTRCQQLGLINSRGEYVVWAADDGVFSPTMAIDKAFISIPDHHKGVVSLKYLERGSKGMKDANWWKMGYHQMLRRVHIPNDYLLVMNALVRRDYLMEIGGWDCCFEHVGLSCPDLSVRLQNDGAEVVLGEKFMDLSRFKGTSGDHAPVYYAHKNDKHIFGKIYDSESGLGRSRIDFNNWKQAEEVWSRRFPKGIK